MKQSGSISWNFMISFRQLSREVVSETLSPNSKRTLSGMTGPALVKSIHAGPNKTLYLSKKHPEGPTEEVAPFIISSNDLISSNGVTADIVANVGLSFFLSEYSLHRTGCQVSHATFQMASAVCTTRASTAHAVDTSGRHPLSHLTPTYSHHFHQNERRHSYRSCDSAI